MKQLLWCSDSD